MSKPLCPHLVSGIIACMGSFSGEGRIRAKAFRYSSGKLDDGECFHNDKTQCVFRLNGVCPDPNILQEKVDDAP